MDRSSCEHAGAHLVQAKVAQLGAEARGRVRYERLRWRLQLLRLRPT